MQVGMVWVVWFVFSLHCHPGNSESGTAILEIIKSKFRLYAALHKLKGSQSSQDGIPLALNTGNFVFPFRNEKEVESTGNGNAPLMVNTGIPFGNGKEVGITRGANNVTSNVISEAFAKLSNILAMQKPLHQCKKPKWEPSPVAFTPTAFVPPAMEQPLGAGPSSAKKRNRKNKKKRKKLQVDARWV